MSGANTINQIPPGPVADQTRQLLARVATIEQALQRIEAAALLKVQNKTGQAISAGGFPIQSVRDPRFSTDAVNLRSLYRILRAEIAVTTEAAAADGDGGGSDIGGGSAPPTIPFLDFFQASREYGDTHPAELANSCQRAGGTWDYMDGLIAYLRTLPDGERVGYNGKRGGVTDPSLDAVAVYHGILPPIEGSNNVWVVDVIGCHCGPEDGEDCTPNATWNNATLPNVAGAWLSVRP